MSLDDLLEEEGDRLDDERLKAQQYRESLSLKAEVRSLRETNKALVKLVEEQERELEVATHIGRERPAPAPIEPRRRSGQSESTLIAVASDWHVEELVDPKTVQGLNEYNPDIAKARAQRFFFGVEKVADMARSHTCVDDLVLCLLGDFMTGYLHDENVATCAMPPLEAVDFVADLLASGIQFLEECGRFKRIVIPCVAGNHGRITKKRWTSKEAGTNFEHLIYRHLARMFRSSDTIEFDIGEAVFHDDTEVYGKRLRLTHGEMLKFNGGMQGFYGRLYKLHLERNKIRPAHWTIAGHWHQLRQFADIGMVNGSLIGTSAYGSQFGHEQPQQAWALMEKARGCTAMGPVFVE